MKTILAVTMATTLAGGLANISTAADVSADAAIASALGAVSKDCKSCHDDTRTK